jgi:hypothetical protein
MKPISITALQTFFLMEDFDSRVVPIKQERGRSSEQLYYLKFANLPEILCGSNPLSLLSQRSARNLLR